jgi:hypothetical protein
MYEIDADEVIEATWHYDGPHNADTVTSAAQAVPLLVRYLNNATQPSKASLPYAVTAYRIISQIAAATDLLPQVLGQLARFLETQAVDPSLYDDRRDRPAFKTAIEAVIELQDAVNAARRLAKPLRAACEAAGHLGNEGPRGRSGV